MKKFLMIAALLATPVMLIAHEEPVSVAKEKPAMKAEAKKMTKKPAKAKRQAKAKVQYTCPMHPEIDRNHPGTCPKCHMDLVLKK